MEPTANNLTLIELLRGHGLLSDTNIEQLLSFQSKWQIATFEAIGETHLLSEARLADFLAGHFCVQRLYAIRPRKIDPKQPGYLDYFTARKYGVFPLIAADTDPTENVRLVLYDPTDNATRQLLDSKFNSWMFMVSERRIVMNAIDRFYPITEQIPQLRRLEEHNGS